MAAVAVLPTVCDAQDTGVPMGAAVEEAVNSITPEDILRRIGIMAHDSMRGRETPSPELDKVAEWIGTQFREMGLRPGGDNGSYLQRYPIQTRQMDTAESGIRLPDGTTWRLGMQVAWFTGETPTAGVRGQGLILMGRPEGPDDFSAVDMNGRIVLWILPETASGDPDFGLVNRTLGTIRAANPAGVVLVTTRPDRNMGQLLARTNRVNTRTGWSADDPASPLLEVTDQTASRFLSGHGVDARASRGQPFSTRALDADVGVTVVFRVLEDATGPNTVGILEGSDPELKDQYVVFSAHMDHVGICQPNTEDPICNGADDNASGTAGIIEAAEAFAMLEPRPRRSMIFVAVSGEEKGLWGSDYFAQHPPVDVDQMVANLNADMIGRNWPDTIVVIGKEHSDLGATLNEVNVAHPELDMIAIDDIWPEERFYFRSDHFNFARRGIPVLFFFNGTHEDYHQPGDHVEDIDAEKESRIVKLMFYLGLEVANRTERPQWNPESYENIVGSTR
jgi:hypothetical protein